MNKVIDFISIDVYNTDILVMYKCTPSDLRDVLEERSIYSKKEINQIMKGTDKLFSSSIASYLTHHKFPALKILSFNRPFEDIYNFNRTVSHECLHATLNILDGVGMELSDSSEESYTYLMGHIFTETARVLLPTVLKELNIPEKQISKFL